MTWLLTAWMMVAQPAGIPGGGPSLGPTADELIVVRRGWHLDVGFDAGALSPPLAPLADALPGSRFLVFGFGDRRYLLARERHAPELLAALWPGRGLMLLTGLSASPEAAFGEAQVVRLPLSREAVVAAQAFIGASLSDTRPVAPGPYEGSVFLPAVPRYSAFHTCNTWVAEVLRSAGLPLRTRGVLFAGPLWRKIRRLAALSRAASFRPSTPPTTLTEPPRSSCSGAADCCC